MCNNVFPYYENNYVVHVLSIVVFAVMAVLYSATCRQIYFCREMQRNASQFRQVVTFSLVFVACPSVGSSHAGNDDHAIQN